MADLQSAFRSRMLADSGLQGLGASQFHWNAVPQGTPYPYVRLQTISDPRPQNLSSNRSSRRTRIRAEVMSPDYGVARAISERIIALTAVPAIEGGVRFGATRATGPRDLGEDTSDGYINRLVSDLSIEHSLI